MLIAGHSVAWSTFTLGRCGRRRRMGNGRVQPLIHSPNVPSHPGFICGFGSPTGSVQQMVLTQLVLLTVPCLSSIHITDFPFQMIKWLLFRCLPSPPLPKSFTGYEGIYMYIFLQWSLLASLFLVLAVPQQILANHRNLPEFFLSEMSSTPHPSLLFLFCLSLPWAQMKFSCVTIAFHLCSWPLSLFVIHRFIFVPECESCEPLSLIHLYVFRPSKES